MPMPKFFDQKRQIPRQLVYSRRQEGDTVFNFYVNEQGKLRAETIRYGKREEAVLIKGIPLPWQNELDDCEKREQVKKALEESYFKCSGFSVEVTPRGLGGWNEDVHKGYSVLDDRLHYTEYGTYRLAMEVGFTSDEAKIIADSCQLVDDRLSTGPYPLGGEQRRHFDTYQNTWGNWAAQDDPRMRYAIFHFNGAVERRAHGDNDAALRSLGSGLHSLQDMFSHTPDFTTTLVGIVAQGYKADDVSESPRIRTRYMIEATRSYLDAYHRGGTLYGVFFTRIRRFKSRPPRRSKVAQIFMVAGMGIFGTVGLFFGGPLGAAGGAGGGAFLGGVLGRQLDPDREPEVSKRLLLE